MKVEDHLSNKQKKKLNKISLQLTKSNKHKKQNKSKPKKEEHIDWVDIMGTRRDTYKRVRGAVRRK